MNKDNPKLWKIIQIRQHLNGQLPDHPNHPKKSRKIQVKNKFNAQDKDIPDDKFNEVMKILKKIQNN